VPVLNAEEWWPCRFSGKGPEGLRSSCSRD
jgi:hypothetical protein